MVTLTGKYLKVERLKKNLNTAELAKMMGYKNVSKGINRITELERGGMIITEVLEKVVEVLNLDISYVNGLIEKGRVEGIKEYEKWLNEPIKMHYVIRMLPTIYLSYGLPTIINSEEEALDYVAKIARSKHKKCWLVLSRNEKVYIDESGQVGGVIKDSFSARDYPYTRLK